MKKNMNKPQLDATSSPTACVIAAFVVMPDCSCATGMLTRSFKGQLVPICVYVVMAVSLNLTVGILGRAEPGPRGLHERRRVHRRYRGHHACRAPSRSDAPCA